MHNISQNFAKYSIAVGLSTTSTMMLKLKYYSFQLMKYLYDILIFTHGTSVG